LVAYENSEKGLAYYDDAGFPWWAYDRTVHGTRYESRERAESIAAQLRAQRARAGRILVVEAAS
jgi:hypothetical protein